MDLFTFIEDFMNFLVFFILAGIIILTIPFWIIPFILYKTWKVYKERKE